MNRKNVRGATITDCIIILIRLKTRICGQRRQLLGEDRRCRFSKRGKYQFSAINRRSARMNSVKPKAESPSEMLIFSDSVLLRNRIHLLKIVK